MRHAPHARLLILLRPLPNVEKHAIDSDALEGLDARVINEAIEGDGVAWEEEVHFAGKTGWIVLVDACGFEAPDRRGGGHGLEGRVADRVDGVVAVGLHGYLLGGAEDWEHAGIGGTAGVVGREGICLCEYMGERGEGEGKEEGEG